MAITLTFTAKKFKAYAAEVAAIAASIGAVLAIIIQFAPTVHIPAPEIAIIVSVSSIVAGIGLIAKDIVGAKLQARKAAKLAKVGIPA